MINIFQLILRAYRSLRIYRILQNYGGHRISETILKSPNDFDVVITWVDGSDAQWLDKRNYYLMLEGSKITSDNTPNRYQDFENLKYILRSIEKFLKGYRQIHIITENPLPPYIRLNSDKLSIHSHFDIFPDPSVLPVFSSSSIEACLHKIPNLIEHFVYLNDDFFFTRECGIPDFFNPYGQAIFKTDKFNNIETFDPNNGNHCSVINGFKLLHEYFPKHPKLFFAHAPIPLLKSYCEAVEMKWPEAFRNARKHKFRNSRSIGSTNSIHPYFHFYNNAGILMPPPIINLHQYDTQRRINLWITKRLLNSSLSPKTLAILDNPRWTRVHYENIKSLLEKLFPQKSEFEI